MSKVSPQGIFVLMAVQFQIAQAGEKTPNLPQGRRAIFHDYAATSGLFP